MSAVVQVKLKVPNFDTLQKFITDHRNNPIPVVGEFGVPSTKDELEKVHINPNLVSHAIRGIREETYDAATRTVVADVVFTGPYGAKAADAYVKNSLRFCPRTVDKVTDEGKIKDAEIITWDLVHRPMSNSAFDAFYAQTKEKMRQEENMKDKINEINKKRRR